MVKINAIKEGLIISLVKSLNPDEISVCLQILIFKIITIVFPLCIITVHVVCVYVLATIRVAEETHSVLEGGHNEGNSKRVQHVLPVQVVFLVGERRWVSGGQFCVRGKPGAVLGTVRLPVLAHQHRLGAIESQQALGQLGRVLDCDQVQRRTRRWKVFQLVPEERNNKKESIKSIGNVLKVLV